MQKRTIRIIIAVVVIVVLAGAVLVGSVLIGGSSGPSESSQEAAASSTVAMFGQRLQQVSLMAPNASGVIASTYAPYVDPTLLQQWENDPQGAPGRVASSPWPDHIAITSVSPQGRGYVVDGNIVFLTSNNVVHGGYDSLAPVVIQVQQESGSWKIVAFQEQNQQ